jgi:hypothetical protein
MCVRARDRSSAARLGSRILSQHSPLTIMELKVKICLPEAELLPLSNLNPASIAVIGSDSHLMKFEWRFLLFLFCFNI